MSEDYSFLNWLWGLICVPIIWTYKINSRLTKIETTQELKIDRLKTLEDKMDILTTEFHELSGVLREHLRR